MGHLIHNFDISKTAHPHDAIHAVCQLPCTVKIGIHPWREHLSKVPDAIKCEHLPTQFGLRRRTAVRSGPRWAWRACRWASLRRYRRSWRWRCWMCMSWAGVVTRGLQLRGRLDVLLNSLKRLWRWLMVEKLTLTLYCVIKLHILEWPFILTSLRHTCAIIMLSNQYLGMPHLWGGWIISTKEKCSLTQI